VVLQQPAHRQLTARDLQQAEELVPEGLFRMFQPHEVAAGMAFPRQRSGEEQPEDTKCAEVHADKPRADLGTRCDSVTLEP